MTLDLATGLLRMEDAGCMRADPCAFEADAAMIANPSQRTGPRPCLPSEDDRVSLPSLPPPNASSFLSMCLARGAHTITAFPRPPQGREGREGRGGRGGRGEGTVGRVAGEGRDGDGVGWCEVLEGALGLAHADAPLATGVGRHIPAWSSVPPLMQGLHYPAAIGAVSIPPPSSPSSPFFASMEGGHPRGPHDGDVRKEGGTGVGRRGGASVHGVLFSPWMLRQHTLVCSHDGT